MLFHCPSFYYALDEYFLSESVGVFFFFLLLTYIIGIKIFYIETSSKLQWNLPERPPLSRDHLTKLPTGTSVTQIAISETSRKRPQLSLTSRVVA